MNTAGHVGTQGGLRGHSVGGMYPWGIVGIGDRWIAFNMVTGEKFTPRIMASSALDDAEMLAKDDGIIAEMSPNNLYRKLFP